MRQPLMLLFLSVGAILIVNVSGATTSATAGSNSTVAPSQSQTNSTITKGQSQTNATSNTSTAANNDTSSEQSSPSPTSQPANSSQGTTQHPAPSLTPNHTSQAGTTSAKSVTQSPNTNTSTGSNLPTTSASSHTQTKRSNTSTMSSTLAVTSPSIMLNNSSFTPSPNTSPKQSSSSKPTNASITTLSPVTNKTVTPEQPRTTVAPTQAATNASSSTERPAVTSSATQPSPSTNTSHTTGQSEPGNGTTTNNTAITTDRPATSNSPSTTMSPGQHKMYISEIMMDRQGNFQKLELYVSSQVDLTHYAVVMVDGGTSKTMSVTPLRNLQPNNSLAMVSFDKSTNAVMTTAGVGVAIYDTDKVSGEISSSWTVSKDGLVDALVIGPSYNLSDQLVQILTPGMVPFVLDPKLYGSDRTITRCSSKLMCSTDEFALLNPSLGRDNSDKCQERMQFQNKLALKFTADCQLFNKGTAASQENIQRLMHFVIMEVNRKCHCGITRMHIEENPHVSCCGGNSLLELTFLAPNEHQGEALLNNYKAFVQTSQGVQMDDQTYSLDNSCFKDCCPSAPTHPGHSKDSSKDTKVTVAVIVTCMLIFMIIVILVILYMRRKKTAVYQFRMSRLNEEEEDYPMGPGDQDEFVGGQEATFDIKA